MVYIICEFFPLGGLDVQLEIWEDRLSVAVQLCVGQQICEAMKVIHDMSILHRDLATRNVLVHSIDAENVSHVWVKVTDFGLAHNGTGYPLQLNLFFCLFLLRVCHCWVT
jgi:serine/threonine protein kinase